MADQPTTQVQRIAKEAGIPMDKSYMTEKQPVTQLERICSEAKNTGIVFLGGEMEFPANEGAMAACYKACEIAEACGYLVQRNGSSRFTVCGGYIVGYFALDWFSPDAKELVKIEHWREQSAYLK